MSKYQEIQDVILTARKQRDKAKADFFKWFLSTLLQKIGEGKSTAVSNEDITDTDITNYANWLYGLHKKTLKLGGSLENIAKYNKELEYIKPYSTMGLSEEQVNFIKQYRLDEQDNPHNLGTFNKALSGAFKQIDRMEARELYESL